MIDYESAEFPSFMKEKTKDNVEMIVDTSFFPAILYNFVRYHQTFIYLLINILWFKIKM